MYSLLNRIVTFVFALLLSTLSKTSRLTDAVQVSFLSFLIATSTTASNFDFP